MVEFRQRPLAPFRSAFGVFSVVLPAACGLGVLATPIIAAIYQHGNVRRVRGPARRRPACGPFSVGLVGMLAPANKIHRALRFYALG